MDVRRAGPGRGLGAPWARESRSPKSPEMQRCRLWRDPCRSSGSMNRHWFAKTRMGRSAVLLAVVVTAALGVCLFDGHDHGDDFMARDLCVGLFVVALPGIVFAGLVVVGAAPSW